MHGLHLWQAIAALCAFLSLGGTVLFCVICHVGKEPANNPRDEGAEPDPRLVEIARKATHAGRAD